jgi:hypothetical protein
MAHVQTHDDWMGADDDIRESVRVIRRERSWHLVGVVVALLAALATAVAYTYLSYNDHLPSAPSGQH